MVMALAIRRDSAARRQRTSVRGDDGGGTLEQWRVRRSSEWRLRSSEGRKAVASSTVYRARRGARWSWPRRSLLACRQGVEGRRMSPRGELAPPQHPTWLRSVGCGSCSQRPDPGRLRPPGGVVRRVSPVQSAAFASANRRRDSAQASADRRSRVSYPRAEDAGEVTLGRLVRSRGVALPRLRYPSGEARRWLRPPVSSRDTIAMRRLAGATGVMWSLYWLASGLTRHVARRPRPRLGVAGREVSPGKRRVQLTGNRSPAVC